MSIEKAAKIPQKLPDSASKMHNRKNPGNTEAGRARSQLVAASQRLAKSRLRRLLACMAPAGAQQPTRAKASAYRYRIRSVSLHLQIPVYRAVVIEAKPKASPEGEVPRRGGGVCGCPAAAKCFGSSTPQSASLTAPLEGSLFGCLHYLKQLDKLEFEDVTLPSVTGNDTQKP